MEPLRRAKTDSFKIRGQRHPSDPSHEVILISPFGYWRHYNYAEALKKWVQTEVEKVNQRPDSRVRLIWRVVQFSINDLFTGKGQDVLGGVVDKLVSRMSGLPSDPESLLNPKRPNRWAQRDDTRTPLPIIFVTHSLGLWVIKGALPRLKLSGLAGHPAAGIVLLDANTTSRPDMDYFSWLMRDTRIPASHANSDKIYKRIDAIDTEFNETLELYPWSPGGNSLDRSTVRHRMPVISFKAWPPENSSAGQSEPHISRYMLETIKDRLRSTKTKLLGDSLTGIGLDKALVVLAMRALGNDLSSSIKGAASPHRTEANRGSQLVSDSTRRSVHFEPDISPTQSSQDLDESSSAAAKFPTWQPPSRPGASLPLYPMPSAQDGSDNVVGVVGVVGDEDDTSSVISIPRITSGEFIPVEAGPIMALAQSFWTNGEFANAHALLERSLSLMGKSEPPPSQIKLFETRMQIAVILLYRGRYGEATEGLQALWGQLPQLPPSDNVTAGHELKRWDALSQMYCGNYSQAASGLKDLSDGGSGQGQISEIQVLRDLALASGLLGRHNDAERHITAAAQRLRESIGSQDEGDRTLWRSKSCSIQYTEAYIDALWGDYDVALEKAHAAFQGFRYQLGSTHLKTLRSATLGVQLLAYTGRYYEAEEQCRKTMRLTGKELGQMHPLNLETIEGLVYILRSQSRLTEALETAKSLCSMTDSTVGPKHPQALRARSQLAATHLAIGNYHTAESEIRNTASLAVHYLGRDHPETLRFCSELSHVLCCSGALDEALATAIDTLDRQRKVYSLAPPQEIQADRPPNPTSNQSPQDQQTKILEETLDEIHREDASFKRHPLLVATLQVIALIEARDPKKSQDRAERIMQAVVLCRRSDLGSDHAQTLLAEYELASVIRNSDFVDDRLSYVNNAFYHVWEERSRLFGPFHPETLSAEREVIMTDCARGRWDDGGPARRVVGYEMDAAPLSKSQLAHVPSNNQGPPLGPAKPQGTAAGHLLSKSQLAHVPSNSQAPPLGPVEPHGTAADHLLPPNLHPSQWMDVERVSETILLYQEAQLGEFHPETIKSLLWLFIVRLLLNESPDHRVQLTWHTLRARLRHPLVQSERLVEALRTEERVAEIFADQNHYDMGMGILHDVLDTATAAHAAAGRDPEHQLLVAALAAIRADAAEEMGALRPHVQPHLDRLEALERAAAAAGKRSSSSHAADDDVAARLEACRLCKRLFGRLAPRTTAARVALAQARWDGGRETEQRKALGMVVKLRSRIAAGQMAAPDPGLVAAIQARCEEWNLVLSGRGEKTSLVQYESAKSESSDGWTAPGGPVSSGVAGGH